MIKNNKGKLLISSLLILLPILVGLIFWDKLPEQMPTHWGVGGKADSWSSRAFSVFALPLILLATHWFCLLITAKDLGNRDQNRKVFVLIFWICPILSFFTNGMIYSIALGNTFTPVLIVNLLMGILFVAIGNYLPKCKQNRTIGIKVKWALENEENWNATHRLAGKVWVIGGLLVLLTVFLPETIAMWAMMAALLPAAFIPVFYSYFYYKKQLKEGRAAATPLPKNKLEKCLTALILIGSTLLVIIVSFTGNIRVSYEDTSFTVNASYWPDLTVEYDAIDTIEYRDTNVKGSRTNGFGSRRFLAGSFRNAEFGNYTRYSYTKCDACVVLTVDGEVLVISGRDSESTQAIYKQITAKMESDS